MLRATYLHTNTNGDGLMAYQSNPLVANTAAEFVESWNRSIPASAKVIENGDGYDIVSIIAHGLIVVVILTDEDKAGSNLATGSTTYHGLKET